MSLSYDHLKLIIQRFDAYVTASNTKAAFLLAFNTFICGGILSGYKTLISLGSKSYQIHINIILVLIFVIGVLCLFFVLRAMYPYMKSGNSSADKYHSLIFFKSVSEFTTSDDYLKKLNEQSNDDVLEDLAKQIHAIGSGLQKKYQFLEYATTTIYVQLCLILVLVYVLIIDKL